MARRERIVARDALCSPRGVAVRKKLNSPARKIEEARLRNARLCRERSLLPGKSESTARYPGIKSTRMRAGSDRVLCRDGGDRWTRAKANIEIKTDAIRCRGGGQASLIFSFLLHQARNLMLN